MNKYELAVQIWRDCRINTLPKLERYLDNFRILFAYNSGKIENPDVTYHDTREIFENGKAVGFTGDMRALFEQYNQKNCYDVIKHYIIEKRPLSSDLIKEIHLLLTSGTYDERRYVINNERSGEYKKHDYVTGINEVGSAPSEVENDITQLIAELSEFHGKDVLKAAAYLHAVFENIHPFSDGNGRVGRTVTNYFLMINDHPPFIVYDEDKKFYYEALQKYDETEDLIPLHNFFQYEVEKTWNKNIERVVTCFEECSEDNGEPKL